MDLECVFAIEFTNENMTAAFVYPDGREEAASGFDLCDFVAGDIQPIEKLFGLLIAKARTAPAKIGAVALSLPCDLDADRQRVVGFSRAAWLNDQRLPEMLERLLGAPVIMERRGVVLLAYDRVMLGLPPEGLYVGCYVDTHYENAIWHQGAPIRGRNGAAGNIAHMAIHDREDVCFCGKTGCVDLYGAGIRLRQMHTMIFPDTPLEEIFVRHGEHPIIRDYLTMMAYPIAIEANILDPDYIILGGNVPDMPGFPREFLQDEIRRLGYSPATREVRFLASAAGSISGGVCAAQYAMVALGHIAAS